MRRTWPAGLAVAAASLAVVAFAQPPSSGDDMKRLSIERGCTTCHSDKAIKPSPSSTLPSAPSWPEIAKRYRGQAGAEDKLAAIVQTGTPKGTRHWSREAAFASMLANDAEVTPEEARSLVRWILAWPD